MDYDFNQFLNTHIRADGTKLISNFFDYDTEIYFSFRDQIFSKLHPALNPICEYNSTANDILKAAIEANDLKLYQATRRAFDYPTDAVYFDALAAELGITFEAFNYYYLVSSELAEKLTARNEPVFEYCGQIWWATNFKASNSSVLIAIASNTISASTPGAEVVTAVPRVKVKFVQEQ